MENLHKYVMESQLVETLQEFNIECVDTHKHVDSETAAYYEIEGGVIVFDEHQSCQALVSNLGWTITHQDFDPTHRSKHYFSSNVIMWPREGSDVQGPCSHCSGISSEDLMCTTDVHTAALFLKSWLNSNIVLCEKLKAGL